MLMSARLHCMHESVSRLLLWLCKGRWVICGSIITLAQYFRPVPLKQLLWLDELPAVTVDTQQRIQSSRGGTELVLLSENELDKQHSSLGKLPVFFSPLSSSSLFFFCPIARLVFGLMGIILSKRPTVMSEAEHLAFFCQVSIFPVSPTWLCTVTVDLAKRCVLLSPLSETSQRLQG